MSAAALGQRLIHPERVLLRLRDFPAGVGMTPSGLWIEHTNDLPAIFGEIIAAGSLAHDAGMRVGMFVLFVRYAGEETDRYEDGRVFAVFHMNDILAHIPGEHLVFSEAERQRFAGVA